MRSLIALVLLAGTAAAYPIVLAKPSAAERAKREAEFRAQNPQHWLVITFDDHGFLRHAETDDATLGSGAPAVLREFARKNASFFNMDPAAADRLAPVNGVQEIVSMLGNNLAGQVVFHPGKTTSIDVVFFVRADPTVKLDDLAPRLAGKTYTIVAGYGHGPQRDCAMVPGGCTTTKLGDVRRDVTLTARDVRTMAVLYDQSGTLRFVHCADLELVAPPPPDPAWGAVEVVGKSYVAKAGAPALPLVVDAVTGAVLATGAKRCDELRNFR